MHHLLSDSHEELEQIPSSAKAPEESPATLPGFRSRSYEGQLEPRS